MDGVRVLDVRWWRCVYDHVFPALEPAPGRSLVCPAYNEEATEWCVTSFIFRSFDTAEAARQGDLPPGQQRWAVWARGSDSTRL